MDKARWKLEGVFKADAQKVYEEIGDGKITPEEILKKARNKKTELHKCFEWDDSIAAEKYRLGQARKIIQFLVIDTKQEQSEKQAVRVFQITSERNVYQNTRLFFEQPDEYTALLQRAKAELKAFQERYHMLSELEQIFAEIDAL